MLVLFLILPLLLSQTFIIYCCVALGTYHAEMDGPEAGAYEDSAQDDYVNDWNRRHMRT